MKKLVFIASLSGIALIGCGGSSDNDNTVVSPQKNILSIQGDQINEKTTINQIADNVEISATGNQPIHSIFWSSSDNKNGNFKIGQIFLNPAKETAELFYLADDIETNNSVNGFLLSSSYCNSMECSKYLMTEGKEELNLQIKFKNIQSVYQEASTIGINATPKSKVIVAQEKDGIIIHPELPTQPDVNKKIVTVTGDLNFKIPSSWPIAQKSRFPVIQTQGQLIFDGKAYQISSTELTHIIGENGKVISATFGISLKSDTDNISLFLTENKDTSRPFGSLIMMFKGDDYYHTEILEAQNFWSESTKEVKLHMSNIGLFNDKTSTIKLLSSNLIIPQAEVAISLNGRSLILNKNRDIQANATNDQKSYQMDFSNEADSISALKIIHELKGHLSANYQTGEETYTCGNREIACAGLSVDSDQKTYRFNQAKVGNNTLNGSVFIPGVFE